MWGCFWKYAYDVDDECVGVQNHSHKRLTSMTLLKVEQTAE
jgi:hypothetical protein